MGYLWARLKIWLVGARNLGGARRKDGVCCHLVVHRAAAVEVWSPPPGLPEGARPGTEAALGA